MQWFRSHHGAPFDSKLAVVARRANVTRGHAASVWWAVLDYASQRDERGSVAGIDPEEIAAAFDYDEDDVARVIDAMRHRELLIDGEDRLTGWNKRQVQREDTGAAERKRRQRSRKSGDGPEMSRNVTQRPAPDKSRVDTDKKHTKQQVATPAAREPGPPEPSSLPDERETDPVLAEAKAIMAAHAEAVCEIFAYPGWQPHKDDLALAKSLARSGFRAAECGALIRDKLGPFRDRGDRPPRALAYFDEAIRDSRKPKPGKPAEPQYTGWSNEYRAERMRNRTKPEREEFLAAMTPDDRAEIEAILARWDAEMDIPQSLRKERAA